LKERKAEIPFEELACQGGLLLQSVCTTMKFFLPPKQGCQQFQRIELDQKSKMLPKLE
jgi:hypothetical protein